MGIGTLLQLIAINEQNYYTIGNPQITFFKYIYKRHTNFSIESIEENITNNFKLPSYNYNKNTQQYLPNSNNIININLSKKGDLLYKIYLEIDLTIDDKYIGTNSIYNKLVQRPGFTLIEYIELEIGGIVIDKRYGEWLDINNQLSLTQQNFSKLNKLINCKIRSSNNMNSRKMYIPLDFWFSKNVGLAIPLFALKYQDVKINISIKSGCYLMSWGNIKHKKKSMNVPILNNLKVFCDYIFIDKNEKKLFKKKKCYLIEQIQKKSYTILDIIPKINLELNFRHPVKELIWTCQSLLYSDLNSRNYSPFNYTTPENLDYIDNVNLYLNNIKRFSERNGTYFRLVQPYQHYIGGYHNNKYNTSHNILPSEKGFIYVYSFSLYPNRYQPSGTCNFTRINKIILSLDFTASGKKNYSKIYNKKNINIYAKNYNILQIENGMCCLLYN